MFSSSFFRITTFTCFPLQQISSDYQMIVVFSDKPPENHRPLQQTATAKAWAASDGVLL